MVHIAKDRDGPADGRASVLKFEGKTAVITGAASGIGAGMASAFAGAGIDLFLLDVDEVGLAAVAESASAGGVRVEYATVDVSDCEAMKQAAASVSGSFERVHFLCNNAGVGYTGVPLDQVPDADWDWVIGVNLRGVINGVQSFLPLVQAHGEGGHVVNTASIGGHHVMPGWQYGVYVTTKFAVVGLSEALALDLADQGIGVSVLSPAAVDTAIYDIGRNRPDRFGGAFRLPVDSELADALRQGMEPAQLGRWVLRAIRDNQFYVFPHPHTRDFVVRRHERLMAAYKWAADVEGDLNA